MEDVADRSPIFNQLMSDSYINFEYLLNQNMFLKDDEPNAEMSGRQVNVERHDCRLFLN